MEHSWIPSGLYHVYDEHCVHKFPCVPQLTNQDLPHGSCDLWNAGCWLADGDVTDDRDPWWWICADSTQKLSGWLWHSLMTHWCIQNHTRLESFSSSCYWIQINSSFQEPTERLVWSAAQHHPSTWYSIEGDCGVTWLNIKSYQTCHGHGVLV